MIVGVNDFVLEDEDIEIPILKIDEEAYNEQVNSIKKAKEMRDNDKVKRCLEELKRVAATPSGNTMPVIIEAVKAYTTMGEICDVFREVYGEYIENPEV